MKKHYILLCLNEPDWEELEKEPKPEYGENRENWKDLKKALKKPDSTDIEVLAQTTWLIPRNKKGLIFVAECISKLESMVQDKEFQKYDVRFLDESVEPPCGATPPIHGSKTAR